MTEICAFLTSDQAAVQGRVRLHKWDWKAQPDLEAIGADLVQLFDGSHCPCVVAVPDTQCDEYAVFISPTHMEPNEAQALWDQWDWEIEEKAGRA